MIRNLITSNGTVNDIAKMFAEKKTFFTAIIDRFSSIESVEKYYETVKNTPDPTGKVSEYMAAPIAEAISRLIGFIAVLLISLIVVKLISMLIIMALRMPVLKQADSLIGAVFGILIGLLISWVLSLIVSNTLDSLIAMYPRIFPEGKTAEEIISSTFLLRLLSGIKPGALIALIKK